MSRLQPDIPARFRRAARRAVYFRWLVRIGGLLLVVLLIVALGVLLFMPRLLRQRAREHLRSAGVEATGDIARLSHRGIVFRDLSFGASADDLRVEELEASFSLGGLRRGRIREVRIRGMSGLAGLHRARWTFGGLERLAWLARHPRFAAFSTDATLMVERVVVEDGGLILQIPGLPTMTLPFILSAELQSDGLYRFTATLSPASQPLSLTGEINPFSGNGRIAAQAKAMELDAWAQYALVEQDATWRIDEFTAKTDLQMATLFEGFKLVWAHVDGELAGVEIGFAPPISTPSPAAAASPQDGKSQATAHSVRVTLDILADDASTTPRIQGAIGIKHGGIRRRRPGKRLTFPTLTSDFGIRWDAQGRPRFQLAGTCTNPTATLAATAWHAEKSTFEIAEFLSLDTLRWQATVDRISGHIGETRVVADSANLAGSLHDAKLEIDHLSLVHGPFTAQASLVAGWDGGNQTTLAGQGALLKLDHGGEALVDSRHAFTFSAGADKRLAIEFPQLASPRLPGARGSALVLNLRPADNGLAFDLRGEAAFPPEQGFTVGGLAARNETGINLSFTLAGVLGDPDEDDEAVVLLPRQNLALAGAGWRASGQAEGRLVATLGGVRDRAILTLAVARLEAASGKQGFSCQKLDFTDLRLVPIGRRRLFEILATPRPMAHLTVDGRVAAEGLEVHTGLSSLKGAAVDGGFAWSGEHGFTITPSTRAHPLTIAISEIGLAHVKLFPKAIKASLDGRKLTLETTLNDRNSAVEGSLFGSFSIGEKAAVLLRLDIRSEAIETIEWLPATIPFPELRRMEIGGGVELTASLFIDAVSVAGTGRLRLHNVSLSSPAGGLSVQGLDSDLSFRELFPPATEPNQWLTFRSARYGALAFSEGGIAFQLPTDGGAFVERAAVQWADGLLTTHAVGLNPKRRAFAADIRGEGLSLGHVLGSQQLVVGNATGTFQGNVPLRIRDGKITTERIALYSTPGQGGRLQLRDPQRFLRLIDASPQTDEAADMLKDMIYSAWRLDVETGEKPHMRFRIDGYGADERRPTPKRLAGVRQLPTTDLREILGFLLDVASTAPEAP